MSAPEKVRIYKLLKSLEDGPLSLTEMRNANLGITSSVMVEARQEMLKDGFVETYLGISLKARAPTMIKITPSGKKEMRRIFKQYFE